MGEDFGYLLQRLHVFVRHMGNATTLNAHSGCWFHHQPFEGQGRDDAKDRLLSTHKSTTTHSGGKCYKVMKYLKNIIEL